MGDDRLWPSNNRTLKKVAERFLKHQSEQREEFPEARIVAREMPFNVQFSDKIVLSGRIDRIDGDMKGHLAVVDYKSSHSEWHLSTKWIERKKLQLLMYGYLIEKYQILEGQGLQRDSKIAGLYYLSAKDFTRKGLGVIGDIEKICNPPRKRKNSNNGREDLEKLYQDFEDLLNGSSSSIFEGHFEPKPLKSETCIDCEYKKLCRVNHSI